MNQNYVVYGSNECSGEELDAETIRRLNERLPPLTDGTGIRGVVRNRPVSVRDDCQLDPGEPDTPTCFTRVESPQCPKATEVDEQTNVAIDLFHASEDPKVHGSAATRVATFVYPDDFVRADTWAIGYDSSCRAICKAAVLYVKLIRTSR